MVWALAACGQGTMIYDQQSATNRSISGGAPIQGQEPTGQSFTPALSSVGFVQLELSDFNPGNGVGATVFLNLRAGSLTGTILDSTEPVFMPDGFSYGITNFFFAAPAAVNPGTVYYLEPILQSGDHWDIIIGSYNYPGGTFFANGLPNPNAFDVWFREGSIVPEPPSGLLVLLGIAGVCAARRARRFRTKCQAAVLIGLLASAGAASAQLQIGERVWSPPGFASYHSMQRPAYPPLPCLPFDAPVYRIAGKTNSYALDDRDIDYNEMEQAQRATQAQASLSMSGILGEIPDGPDPLDNGTNLHLQIARAEVSLASLSGP